MKMCVFLAAVVASLVFASGALADSLHCAHGANCGAGSIGGGISSGSAGTLPFTGLDLAGPAGLAAVLLTGGVGLYRVGRGPS